MQLLLALATVIVAAAPARAGFNITCAPLATARIDPIVNPGAMSRHVHIFHGGNAISNTTTFADTQAPGVCTACSVVPDNSNYWMPALYHINRSTGTYEIVPDDGARLYYQHIASSMDPLPMEEFPPGHQMLVGNASATSVYIAPGSKKFVPVTFQCLASSDDLFDGLAPTYNGRFPDKVCEVWSVQLVFPNCWSGQPLDRANVSAHMVFTEGARYGPCPATHPHRFMTINFRKRFQLHLLPGWPKILRGDLVLANGDARGFSMHADFLNGWVPGTLAPMFPCLTSQCPPVRNATQSDAAKQACQVPPGVLPSEPVTDVAQLPGNPCPPGSVCMPSTVV